jgi:ATP-dependent DNA helicase PIF1
MMSLKLFETLDAIGKSVRKDRRPYGGLQLVFSGDFYQLPPVGDKDDPDTSKFCFESEFWFTTFPKERQTTNFLNGINPQIGHCFGLKHHSLNHLLN